MYGLVNKAIQDLVVQQFGDEAWQRIAAVAGFQDGQFLSMETYDDELTYRLVNAGSEILGEPADLLLEAFGEFWIRYTAAEGYGDLMDLFGSDFPGFLANLDAMHARVGLSMPELRPPSFTYVATSDGEGELRYHSERPGLTPMVDGLLRGLAARFGADVDIQRQPRAAGADHDVFLIRARTG